MDHRSVKYPYVRGRGPLEAAACFQMLSQHLAFRRDSAQIIVILLIATAAFPSSGVVPLQNDELKFSIGKCTCGRRQYSSSDAQVAR